MTLLKTFIEPHIAGSPTNPEIRWVSLKPVRLAELFFDEYKINVSNGFVKRELTYLQNLLLPISAQVYPIPIQGLCPRPRHYP